MSSSKSEELLGYTVYKKRGKNDYFFNSKSLRFYERIPVCRPPSSISTLVVDPTDSGSARIGVSSSIVSSRQGSDECPHYLSRDLTRDRKYQPWVMNSRLPRVCSVGHSESNRYFILNIRWSVVVLNYTFHVLCHVPLNELLTVVRCVYIQQT